MKKLRPPLDSGSASVFEHSHKNLVFILKLLSSVIGKSLHNTDINNSQAGV